MIREVKDALKPLNARRNVVVFVSILYILAGLLPPYLMGVLIDELYPDFTGMGAHVFMVSTIVGLLLVVFFLDWLQAYLKADLINRGVGIARSSFFWNVLHKDYKFFLTHPVGDINNKVIHDSSTYVKTRLMMVPTLLLNVLHLIVLFVFLFRLNTQMTLFVLLFSFVFFVSYSGINRQMRKHSVKEREGFSELMSQANATLTGVDTIQLYAGEDYAAEYFEKLVDRYETELTALKFWQTLSVAATNTIANVVPLAAIIAGIFYFLVGGTISVGSILAFYYFLPRLKDPLKKLTDFNIDLQNAKAVEERVKELLSGQKDVQVELDHVDKIDTLAFEGLGFAYRDGKKILTDMNFSLKRGDTLAITGPSGAGKTTLLRLLKRQVTPTAGKLLVNDRDYTEIEATSYISRIAVLPQEVFIFDDTIAENISFGKSYSEKQIRDAAKLAVIDHFSMDENALGLSGGERQRIGIARALSCEFDVLILDEPTSELDYETECQVIEHLKQVQKETNCILIVVTHSHTILDQLCAKELVLKKI